MAKIININSVIDGLRTAVRRFPVSFLIALSVAVTGLLLNHQASDASSLVKLFITLILGFFLFVSLDLIREQNNAGSGIRFTLGLAGLGLMAGYYFYLPSDLNSAGDSVIYRSVSWGLSLILLAVFSAFLKKPGNSSGKMLYFNSYLLFSLILTGIWAVIVMGGVSIAILSVNFLFKAGISDRIFMDLATVIFGFFVPAFMLSRIPAETEQEISPQNYPKELRLLLQYVLVPLVALYFLILYAYVIRILILWEWPEGTLAYMILGFSVLGMLVHIALYPLRDSVEWVKKAGNIFFLALIPQTGMLFWTLWFRISQYGITENRYYVFLAGLWLLAISLYFLAGRKKDLKIIPVSLFLLAILTSFGPWGALTVSEESQHKRLEELLVKNGILADGRIKKADINSVPLNDKKEIGAIANYLISTHGNESFVKFFPEQELAGLDGTDRRIRTKQVMEKFGLNYIESWASGQQNFRYNSEPGMSTIRVSRFDYAIRDQGMQSGQTIGNNYYQFGINEEKNTFEVSANGTVIAEKDLTEFLDKLSKTNTASISGDLMILTFENNRIALEYHIERIGGELSESGYEINLIQGLLLFTLK